MKSRAEKVYDNLKQKLLDASYASNSLLEKAEAVKKEDHKYDQKVQKINAYLLEKITHGDGIAYSLLYIAYADKIDKLIKQPEPQEFISF